MKLKKDGREYEERSDGIFHQEVTIGNFYFMPYIGSSFKYILKVGVEKWIVNAPRITDHGSAV
jgi:hypothetical protein